MSLCQNVIRRGAVYWWRKKVRDPATGQWHILALSLKVREPRLAKTLSLYLNKKFCEFQARIMSGTLSIAQTRTLLAYFIEKERDALDDSIFRFRYSGGASKRIGTDAEKALISEQRALAGAYELAADHVEWEVGSDDDIRAWCKARNYTADETNTIVAHLNTWLPTMAMPGSERFGPSLPDLEEALTSVGADTSLENIDLLWRQFLKVRAKALGDYERRHRDPLIDLDSMFHASTKFRKCGEPLDRPVFVGLKSNVRVASASDSLATAPLPTPKKLQIRLPDQNGEMPEQLPAKVEVIVEGSPSSVDEPKLSQQLLSEVCREFQRKTYEIRNERSPKGEAKSASNHAVLIWILGDKPLASYSSVDVSIFEDVYRRLPHDYKNLRKDKQTAMDVVVVAEAMRKSLPSIKDLKQRRRLEKRLSPLSA